jgi:sarcosine oxidase subunit gamma
MITKKSPLQGMHIGTVETVAIREIAGLHTLDLRVAQGTAAFTAVADLPGMNLPNKTGLISIAVERLALCLAPDWWLLIGFETAEAKLASLKFESDHHFSIVDVSGQRTTIEVKGPHARDVLAHLWEQDLREKNFPVGTVSQGLMAKAPVIVYHFDPLCFRVLVRSSFAVHLWKALVDAAEEWV